MYHWVSTCRVSGSEMFESFVKSDPMWKPVSCCQRRWTGVPDLMTCLSGEIFTSFLGSRWKRRQVQVRRISNLAALASG